MVTRPSLLSVMLTSNSKYFLSLTRPTGLPKDVAEPTIGFDDLMKFRISLKIIVPQNRVIKPTTFDVDRLLSLSLFDG